MSKQTTLIGAGVTVALIAAYVTLTVLNHDANAVLGLLIGYLGGAATPVAASTIVSNKAP